MDAGTPASPAWTLFVPRVAYLVVCIAFSLHACLWIPRPTYGFDLQDQPNNPPTAALAYPKLYAGLALLRSACALNHNPDTQMESSSGIQPT